MDFNSHKILPFLLGLNLCSGNCFWGDLLIHTISFVFLCLVCSFRIGGCSLMLVGVFWLHRGKSESWFLSVSVSSSAFRLIWGRSSYCWMDYFLNSSLEFGPPYLSSPCKAFPVDPCFWPIYYQSLSHNLLHQHAGSYFFYETNLQDNRHQLA